jgi:hypothetical protein
VARQIDQICTPRPGSIDAHPVAPDSGYARGVHRKPSTLPMLLRRHRLLHNARVVL